MQVGLREANQAFSRIVQAVRRGEEVTLTDRGKPLARIVPVRPSDVPEAAIQRLEANEFLRPAASAELMPAYTLRSLHGAPLTTTLRDERDSS
jgi:prevent-host-death family protein